MLPHYLPAYVRQQRRAGLSHPWRNTQTIGLLTMSVKLSDKIFDLPCKCEQPASPMVMCALPCNGHFSLFARHPLSTLVQERTGLSHQSSQTLWKPRWWPAWLHAVLLPCRSGCVLRLGLKSGFLMRAPVVTASSNRYALQSRTPSCAQRFRWLPKKRCSTPSLS